MTVFVQKWLCSGKSGCIRAKVVIFGQKWLFSGKSGCIRFIKVDHKLYSTVIFSNQEPLG